GTTTPNCVRSTAYDGLARGFNVAVLRDATSSRSPEAQEANLADMEAAGTQLIHTDDFAVNGLLHVRDTEAEVARAVALELEAKARNTETDAAADTAAANDSGAPLPPTPTLESIETVSTGWINKYHLHYTLPDGRPYTYEGVSRKGPERYEAALEALGNTGAPTPDAVCIVPLLPDGSVLLEREFRYPLNSWVVGLPAGLVEPGEDLAVAVDRELREETGYGLRTDIPEGAVELLPQAGHSSTGMSDESVQTVFAQVEKDEAAHPEHGELIEVFTLPLREVPRFLKQNPLPLGTRLQLVLEIFARNAK
ncbi:isochorismatase family protein, partial [Senegalimassilia sp.]|uniref:isochorismatase family protein n=1 Tax=Senegalimassilia sp. TaxID=1922200 RepID=UPI0028465664